MSYDITSLNVKETNQLTISIMDLLTDDNVRSLEPSLKFEGNLLTLQYLESNMSFIINNQDELQVEHLSVLGEASGHVFDDLFLPLLKKSDGLLRAIVVWEGGDTIEELTIDNDGVVTRKDIN